jgi:multisubunit Na+/H+ antiporter MnhE subunit
LTPGDLLLGAFAGLTALALGLMRPLPAGTATRPLPRALWHAVPLLAHVLADSARGFWRVALLSLGSKRLPAPGIVEIEIGARSPRGTALTGLLATISPGTILLDIDEKRGVMIFHVVGSNSTDFRHSLDRLYADHQRHLVP